MASGFFPTVSIDLMAARKPMNLGHVARTERFGKNVGAADGFEEHAGEHDPLEAVVSDVLDNVNCAISELELRWLFDKELSLDPVGHTQSPSRRTMREHPDCANPFRNVKPLTTVNVLATNICSSRADPLLSGAQLAAGLLRRPAATLSVKIRSFGR